MILIARCPGLRQEFQSAREAQQGQAGEGAADENGSTEVRIHLPEQGYAEVRALVEWLYTAKVAREGEATQDLDLHKLQSLAEFWGVEDLQRRLDSLFGEGLGFEDIRIALKDPTPEASSNLAMHMAALLLTAQDEGSPQLNLAGSEQGNVPATTGSDLTIGTVKVHKAIVCARSKYVERALMGGFKESSLSFLELGFGYSKEGILAVIEFVYTGRLNVQSEEVQSNICEVLSLADECFDELASLTAQATTLAFSMIDDDTVLQLFAASDAFNIAQLRAACLDYILDRMGILEETHADEIGELPGHLQDEIMSRQKRYLMPAMNGPATATSGCEIS